MWDGEGGIRTLEAGISPPNALAGRRLQPLGHFSSECEWYRGALVVDAGDQIAAAENLDGGTGDADVEGRGLGEEDLVAGVDSRRLPADGRDDPGATARVLARGDDEAGPGLGLLLDRLHDEVIVERLEREVDSLRLLEHCSKCTPPPGSPISPFRP